MDVNQSVNGLNLFLRTKMRLSVVSPSALEPQRSLQTCRTDLTGSIHQTQELHLKLDAVKPAAVSDSLQSVWALIFTLFMTLGKSGCLFLTAHLDLFIFVFSLLDPSLTCYLSRS